MKNTKKASDREKLVTLAKLLKEPCYQNKEKVVTFGRSFYLMTVDGEEFISRIENL